MFIKNWLLAHLICILINRFPRNCVLRTKTKFPVEKMAFSQALVEDHHFGSGFLAKNYSYKRQQNSCKGQAGRAGNFSSFLITQWLGLPSKNVVLIVTPSQVYHIYQLYQVYQAEKLKIDWGAKSSEPPIPTVPGLPGRKCEDGLRYHTTHTMIPSKPSIPGFVQNMWLISPLKTMHSCAADTTHLPSFSTCHTYTWGIRHTR